MKKIQPGRNMGYLKCESFMRLLSEYLIETRMGMGLLILAVLILLVLSIICVAGLKRVNKELAKQNFILEEQLKTNDNGFAGISEALEDIKHESRRSSDIFAAAEMLMLMSNGSQAAALKGYKDIAGKSAGVSTGEMSEVSSDIASSTAMEDSEAQNENDTSYGTGRGSCSRKKLSESEIESIIKD